MISLPPSDSDLHAYVDHQLSEQDRRLLEHYLASHPQVAARVQAWQQDAQHLRAALLPPGSRREGPLQAQYWSGQGYNYAMVGPAEIPL